MSKNTRTTIGIVAVAIAVIGVGGLVMSYGTAPDAPVATNETTIQPEAARWLFHKPVNISAGPVEVSISPFSLVYAIISTGLGCLAMLIALANCLFYSRRTSAKPRYGSYNNGKPHLA